ncbi:hypothetical protein ACVWW1_004353 [Bradyrhizobium sp. JR3.5]
MDMDTGGAITVGAAITTVGAAVVTMAGTGAITTVGGIITAIGGDVLNQWQRPHLICVRSLFLSSDRRCRAVPVYDCVTAAGYPTIAGIQSKSRQSALRNDSSSSKNCGIPGSFSRGK